MKIKILCTLGPASRQPRVLRQLDERGVDLFRINLSHTPLQDFEEALERVQEHSSTAICLDTEGPQVRCGPMGADVVLEEGSEVALVRRPCRAAPPISPCGPGRCSTRSLRAAWSTSTSTAWPCGSMTSGKGTPRRW